MRRILSLLLVISILTTTVFAGTYEPETYVNSEPIQVEVSMKPEVVTVAVNANNGIFFLAGLLTGWFVLGASIAYYMYLRPKFLDKKQKRKLLNE